MVHATTPTTLTPSTLSPSNNNHTNDTLEDAMTATPQLSSSPFGPMHE